MTRRADKVLTRSSPTALECGLGDGSSTPPVDGHSVLQVPAEWLDALAELVAARLERDTPAKSPWLTRKDAAAYLGVSIHRLEKDKRVPCVRWEGRILYDARQLDEWLHGMGS